MRALSVGLVAATMTIGTLVWNRHVDLVSSDLPWTRLLQTLDAVASPVPSGTFAFVDVSDAQEVWLDPGTGEQVVRTNRRLLREFAEALATAPDAPRFTTLDLLFDTPSPEDSALGGALTALGDRVLVPSVPVGDGTFTRPLVDVPHAPAQVQSARGLALRFRPHAPNGAASLPLQMAKSLHPQRRPPGSIALGAVYFRPAIDESEEGEVAGLRQLSQSVPLRTVVELVRAMETDAERALLVNDFYNDKIVVVGHMEGQDQHQTVAGAVPGSVILASAYLALAEGRDYAHVSVLLVLFVGFIVVLVPFVAPSKGALVRRLRPRPPPASRASRTLWRAARRAVGRASAARVFVTLLALHAVLFIIYRAHVPVLFWTAVLVGVPATWRWSRVRYRLWRRRTVEGPREGSDGPSSSVPDEPPGQQPAPTVPFPT